MLDKKEDFDKMQGRGFWDVVTAEKAIFFKESPQNVLSPKGSRSTWIFNQANSSEVSFCSWFVLAGLKGCETFEWLFDILKEF